MFVPYYSFGRVGEPSHNNLQIIGIIYMAVTQISASISIFHPLCIYLGSVFRTLQHYVLFNQFQIK